MPHRKAFIDKIREHAIRNMKETGILASLTVAQAILESNWGRSGLATRGNNLFGIKGAYNGQSIQMGTWEVYNGQRVDVNAHFRLYPSWYESLQDHASLLTRLARYSEVVKETNWERACVLIQKSGYATDPDYGSKLQSIIRSNKLFELDDQARRQTVAETTVSATFKKHIERMKEKGVSDGSRPKDQATREEVITMMDRLYELVMKEVGELVKKK